MQGLEQTTKLLELIRERGFRPGDKLPSERDLAVLFGMSRGTVREALIRLDTLRMVDSRPKSGIYLQPSIDERSIEAMVLFANTDTPLESIEVAQSVEMRSVLESESMRLACLRRTPRDLERLQQILRASEAAIEAGQSIADLDAEFHKAIVAATQNQVMLRFINVFYLMSRKRRDTYFHDPTQSRRSHAQHLRLYDAIAAQDVERGLALLRRHLKGVDAYFRMFFSEVQNTAPASRVTREARAPSKAGKTRSKSTPIKVAPAAKPRNGGTTRKPVSARNASTRRAKSR